MNVDPFSSEALEDPYPLYDHLQREQPVTQLAGTDIWLVSRHADVVEAASKPDTQNILTFYMGKNTPERKDYIMRNLVVPVED